MCVFTQSNTYSRSCLKIGVATGPTEFVSPMCKLSEHVSFEVTHPIEVGEGFGLVPDIAADQLV